LKEPTGQLQVTQYARYAIISQVEQRIVSWCSLRRHANDKATEMQRKTGGVYLVARIVAYTDSLIRDNVTRRLKGSRVT
jgi:hypothetical protein